MPFLHSVKITEYLQAGPKIEDHEKCLAVVKTLEELDVSTTSLFPFNLSHQNISFEIQ